MGDSALVEADGIEIVLCSLRNQAMGTDLFTQLGCDLAAKKIVVVKSSQHFHASYLEDRHARDLRRRTGRGDARPAHAAVSQDPPSEVAAGRLTAPMLLAAFASAPENSIMQRRSLARLAACLAERRPARRGGAAGRGADQDAARSSPMPT